MKSLLARMWLVVAIALLPVLGFQAYSEHQARTVRRHMMEDEALRLVRLVDFDHQRIVEGAEQVLNVIAGAPSVQDGHPETCRRLLANLMEQSPRYATVAVIGLDGHVMCSPFPFDRELNFSDRAHFRLALQTGAFAIGEYTIGRISGKASIHMAKPFRNRDGVVAGIVDVALSLDWLGQELKTLALPAGVTVSIRDRYGTMLARYPGTGNAVGSVLPAAAMPTLQGSELGVADLKGNDGVTRLVGYAPVRVGPNGLRIAVGLDPDLTFAVVTQPNRVGLTLIVSGFALALALTAFMSKFLIRRPLNRLLAVADHWRTGDFTVRTGLARDKSEFGRLAAAFDRMAAAQDAREVALAESNLRFRAMAKAVPSLLFEADPAGANIWASEAWLCYTGMDADMLAGRGWTATVHPDERDSAVPKWQEAMRTGQDYVGRRRIRRARDGVWRWHLIRAMPVLGASGEILRWLGSATDVHDLTESEEILHERQEILRLFVERAPAAIAMFDNDMCYLAVSRRFIADYELGVEPSALIGRSHYDVFSDSLEQWRDIHRRVLAGETISAEDDPFVRGDGRTDWVRWEMLPWHRVDGSIGGLLLFAELITKRKLAEMALRESDTRLHDLVDTLNLGTFVTKDIDGTIRFWSDGCVRLYGWTAAEALGKLADDLLQTVASACAGEIAAALRRDGEWAGDARQVTKDGREITVTKRAVLRRASDGHPDEILLAVTDVTAQRRAEARAGHAERIQALGQLAGGIAHDFNNTLQAVAGEAALIERRAGDAAAVRRHARRVQEAIQRGASITRRLLAFGRRDDLTAEPLELAPLLSGLREILAHTLGTRIDIQVEMDAGLRPVFADSGQLETVLVNLATNARDAMPDGGRLTLSAEAEIVPVDGTGHPARLVPGRYVRISVTDSGEGMDAATLSRVFEPFFTTKEIGSGTGLGLPMAKGFTEQSGGALKIESRPGAGTTVMLWLPEADRDAAPVRVVAPQGTTVPAVTIRPAVPARLLVVDDEESVREALAENLECEGFDVTVAASGAEAFAILTAGEAVDALVTDLSMPRMDGLALIRAAQKCRPGLPAVLLTGYAGEDNTIAVGGVVSGSFSLLRKPIRVHDLVDRIEALLAVRAGMKR